MNMDMERVRRLNGLQLAFIGDTVYDLYVRGAVLEEHDGCMRDLHRRAVSRVNAGAQARVFDALEPLLTQEEAEVARRARNAHTRPPKNQDPAAYCRATALEALIGYLYLCGRQERLRTLMDAIPKEEQNG
jgi:ribonuclease-3 family protein